MPIKSYLGKTFGGSARPLVSEGLKLLIFHTNLEHSNIAIFLKRCLAKKMLDNLKLLYPC